MPRIVNVTPNYPQGFRRRVRVRERNGNDLLTQMLQGLMDQGFQGQQQDFLAGQQERGIDASLVELQKRLFAEGQIATGVSADKKSQRTSDERIASERVKADQAIRFFGDIANQNIATTGADALTESTGITADASRDVASTRQATTLGLPEKQTDAAIRLLEGSEGTRRGSAEIDRLESEARASNMAVSQGVATSFRAEAINLLGKQGVLSDDSVDSVTKEAVKFGRSRTNSSEASSRKILDALGSDGDFQFMDRLGNTGNDLVNDLQKLQVRLRDNPNDMGLKMEIAGKYDSLSLLRDGYKTMAGEKFRGGVSNLWLGDAGRFIKSAFTLSPDRSGISKEHLQRLGSNLDDILTNPSLLSIVDSANLAADPQTAASDFTANQQKQMDAIATRALLPILMDPDKGVLEARKIIKQAIEAAAAARAPAKSLKVAPGTALPGKKAAPIRVQEQRAIPELQDEPIDGPGVSAFPIGLLDGIGEAQAQDRLRKIGAFVA